MAQPAHSNDKPVIGVLYGFRALMVLAVCNFHFWQQSWLMQQVHIAGHIISFDFVTRSGYLFVDGMILMSGFLLYLPHAHAAAYGTHAPDTKTFYQKRFMRIVPSYLASVLIMLVFVLADGAYVSAEEGMLDLLAHLSFTFTFFRRTYLFSPLNSVLWTIGIEVQFYLLFPLLIRFMRTKPAPTLLLMAASGVLFRTVAGLTAGNLSMLLNQLPAFLDVYALGMLGAILYIRLRQLIEEKSIKTWVSVFAVPLFLLSIIVLLRIFRFQSAEGAAGMDALQRSQWMVRLPLALTLLTAMLSASFMPSVLQKLLDNKLMRFLSVISLNLYIWHQVLSAKFLRPFFTDALQSTPALQIAYTLTCYSLSILTAMVFTYGLEHPAAKWIQKQFKKKGETKNERPTPTETR